MRQRFLRAAAVFCCLCFLCVGAVSATEFSLGETDMSLTINDDLWYVFTRNNVAGNPELEELGLTEEQANDIFLENMAYMDAVLYYDDGSFLEVFVRKTSPDNGPANLSNYEDSEVQEFAEALAEGRGREAAEHSVYKTQYKFACLEYQETLSGNDYYILEYCTIVNRESYTITAQSFAPFTEWERAEIESMINSIRFDVDTTLTEPKQNSFSENVLKGTIIGAISGGLVGGVAALIAKKKKKAAQPAPDAYSPEQEK